MPLDDLLSIIKNIYFFFCKVPPFCLSLCLKPHTALSSLVGKVNWSVCSGAVDQLNSPCQVSFCYRSCSFWADTIKFTIKSSVHSKWSVRCTCSHSVHTHDLWHALSAYTLKMRMKKEQYDSSSHMHQSHKLDDCCRMCNGKLQLSYWCRDDQLNYNWLPMRCFIHYTSTEFIATHHHYYWFSFEWSSNINL